jgi:hypothetical protein
MVDPEFSGQVQKTDSIHWRTPERSEFERLVLAIGTKELGSAIGHPALGEEVVDQHVSCREKVVELGVHRGLRVGVAIATPDFGGLRAASSQPAGNLESII